MHSDADAEVMCGIMATVNAGVQVKFHSGLEFSGFSKWHFLDLVEGKVGARGRGGGGVWVLRVSSPSP